MRLDGTRLAEYRSDDSGYPEIKDKDKQAEGHHEHDHHDRVRDEFLAGWPDHLAHLGDDLPVEEQKPNNRVLLLRRLAALRRGG